MTVLNRREEDEVNDTDARLWHLWLRINRVLRVMLCTHWNAEGWAQVRIEFKRALELAERDPATRDGATNRDSTR